MFDHTLVIARDDPHLSMFEKIADLGLQDQGGVCDIRIVEAVGCEKFAELAYRTMDHILRAFQSGGSWSFTHRDRDSSNYEYSPRYPIGSGVRLRSVEVFEHAGNSATYEG